MTPSRPARAAKNVRWWIRRQGWDLVRYGGGIARVQQHAWTSLGVDLVIDVGANEGQYVRDLRLRGYTRQVLSLEPGSTAYARLERQARDDRAWDVRRAAIGRKAGHATLGVSHNLQSSSLLEISDEHVNAAADAAFVTQEQVEVVPLDELAVAPDRRVWLKLDCQGSEADALDGGSALLDQVHVIQCEMSLREMYRGESTIDMLLPRLVGLGFEPIWIEPGFLDPRTGAALQVEVLLTKPTAHM